MTMKKKVKEEKMRWKILIKFYVKIETENYFEIFCYRLKGNKVYENGKKFF